MPESLHCALPVADGFATEYLEFNRVLPLRVSDGVLSVACHGAPDPEVLADLGRWFNASVEVLEVPLEDLQEGIRRAFVSGETVLELVRDLSDSDTGEFTLAENDDLTDARAQATQPPVVRFVNLLLREAHAAAASDVHLEATREGLRVRLRIDGILTDMPTPPRALQAAVISRLKLLAEMDIAERRLPQDGRIRVRLDARDLDLRVSTVPALHGESVVVRLLDRGGRPVSLEALGMASRTLADFQAVATRPHGIVLVSGPTGSGKTTTLYAAMALRRVSEEKVITVEDPVEYHLPGVTQVPVHARAGVTFASALRSILRQDPDVLMVGEMRDVETAGIAIQAAMTGHLVLSTIHTNDAVSALTRLVDLKVEPYMVAATVESVLAQRLVRRICPECRERYRPDPEAIAVLSSGASDEVPSSFERGAGCAHCRETGYRGRAGLFELLAVTDGIRRVLLEAPDVTRLRAVALREGMVTLRQDGWAKVKAGTTTVEEVLRVVQA